MSKKAKTIIVWKPSLMGMMMEAHTEYDFKTEYVPTHIAKQDKFHDKNFFRGKQYKK